MSFDLDGGRLAITDGATVVFDSDQKLMHMLTPPLVGSLTRPSLDWGTGVTPRQREYDGLLGALPAQATHVAGLVRFTFATGFSYLPGGAWFQLGGTFVLEHKTFASLSGVVADYPSSIGLATIYKSGNQLRFHEKLVLADDSVAGPNLSLAGYTVDYRAWGVAFT